METIASALSGAEKPNAQEFCKSVYANLFPASTTIDGRYYTLHVDYVVENDDSSSDDGSGEDEGDDDDEGIEEIEGAVERPESEVPGYCELQGSYSFNYSDEDTSQFTSEKPSFPSTWCTAHGYVNMKNMSSETVDCQCDPSTYIIAANNEKACFAPPTATNEQVYDFNGRAVYCSTDFNSKMELAVQKFNI